MFGELFDAAPGYRLSFGDIDPGVVAELRTAGCYEIELTGLLDGARQLREVRGFDVFDIALDREAYLARLARSRFVAVALFPDAFDSAIADLARAVSIRYAEGHEEPMAILLGANYVGQLDYFRPRILERLTDAEREHLERTVAIVTTRANRKVVYPPGADSRLRLLSDDKPKLLVDDGFVFPPGFRYPGFFERVPSTERFMVEKIWSENLEHLSFVFAGSEFGCTTLAEAVRHPVVRGLVSSAWLEARHALRARYGIEIPSAEAKEEVYRKFQSPLLADSFERIARDTKRKLMRGDRLVGPALLSIETGSTPFFIARMIACGFRFRDESIPDSVEITDAVREEGIDAAVLRFCGLDLARPGDRTLFDLITGHYAELRIAGRKDDDE